MELNDNQVLSVFAKGLCEQSVRKDIIIVLNMEASAANKKYSAEGYKIYKKKIGVHWRQINASIDKKFRRSGVAINVLKSHLSARMSANSSSLISMLAEIISNNSPGFVSELNENALKLTDLCSFSLYCYIDS